MWISFHELISEIIMHIFIFRLEHATLKENVKKDLVFQMEYVLKGMVSAVFVRIKLFSHCLYRFLDEQKNIRL